MDKAQLAVTKWLPLSASGAAVSFITGFILHISQLQVITSAILTAILVFGGLAMQSFGREDKEQKAFKTGT